MTKKNQIYKCEICGNIVEMLHEGSGELVCCGEKMNLINPKKEEVGTEKHLPVMERNDNKIEVKIGHTEHPMQEDHYIEWIEIITPQKNYRKNLKPTDKPFASFTIKEEILKIRSYCNVHGLWEISL